MRILRVTLLVMVLMMTVGCSSGSYVIVHPDVDHSIFTSISFDAIRYPYASILDEHADYVAETDDMDEIRFVFVAYSDFIVWLDELSLAADDFAPGNVEVARAFLVSYYEKYDEAYFDTKGLALIVGYTEPGTVAGEVWRVFYKDGTITFAVDKKESRSDLDNPDPGVYHYLVEFRNKGEITKAVLVD